MVDLVNAIRDGQSFVGLPDTIVADEEVMVLSPTAGPTIFTILLMILVKVKEKNLSTLFTVVNSPLGEPPNTVNNKLLLNIITYEDVNNNRFGITGLSGGGTMSWFTGAADERIKVICPVCQTGTIEQHIRERTIDGHCDCTFWTNTYGWDFPDVACLIAPRPLLVSAATEDILFRPYAYRSLVHRVRMLYRVYNKEENIGLVEDVSKHGYTPKIRLAIFNWFEKYLKGSSATITDDISDREETTKTLSVYKAGKPPENDRMKKIDRFFIPLPKQMTFEKKKEWQKYQCQAIETLRTVTFRSFPKKISLPYANARRDGEDENFQYRTYEFETEPDLLIRARLCIPIAAPKPYSVVVAPLSLDARSPFMGQGAGLEGLNSMIAGKGIIEVRGTGGTSIGRGLEWTVRRAYPLLGQTLFERQTFDLLQSIAIIRSEKNVGKIIVFGNGASAVIAIYAALLDQDIAGIILDKPIATHFNGGPEFLNVLKIGDIPHNLALLFPRPITFINNLPSVFSQVKKLYQKYGEGDKVQTIPALSQWTR